MVGKASCKVESAPTGISVLWFTTSSMDLLPYDKKKIYLNYILASGRTPLGKNLTRGV